MARTTPTRFVADVALGPWTRAHPQTPFTIMFGPDKCGTTNKVHFIFRHKNPMTGLWEEKHLKNPPAPKITKTTALYTLIVK